MSSTVQPTAAGRKKKKSVCLEDELDNLDVSTAKLIRTKIFRIPMLDNQATQDLFRNLDMTLNGMVKQLCLHIPYVRESFCQITEKVLAGGTLGKNYYDKRDGEDGKIKAKKDTIYQPSETRVLSTAFLLLRERNVYRFADTVLRVGFIRGVKEEEVSGFLSLAEAYRNVSERAVRAREQQNPEYAQIEIELQDLQKILGTDRHDEILQTGETVLALWNQYVDIRTRIMQPYLRKVYTIAKQFSSKGNESQVLDNFQSGVFGLARAIRNYTPTRFAHFSLVAEMWVKQSILQYLRTEVNFIRLPMANWHNMQKIERAREILVNIKGRDFTVEDIALHTGLSVPRIKKTIENSELLKMVSLNRPTANEESPNQSGAWNLELVRSETPEDPVRLDSDLETVRALVSQFDPEEKIIFGLISGCYEILPEPELSATDLWKERIRQKAAEFGLRLDWIDTDG